VETKHTSPLSSPGRPARDSFLGFVGGCFRLLFTVSWKRRSPLESKRPDLKFEAQVRKDLGFLFTQYDAKIISNNYNYRVFGNANIVIKAGDLVLNVVRDRGEIHVYVAREPVTVINAEWKELGCALAALVMDESNDQIPGPFFYATLSRVADLLKPALPQLQEAFSAPRYQATARKIRLISESYWKKFQALIKLKSKVPS